MTQEIDVRGLSCPQPVIMVKKAIDAGAAALRVTTDDAVARENISRLAAARGLKVSYDAGGGLFILNLTKA
ncbi:MAG: sulfurtransferase TusA family protein [Planctomycetota bacterium]